MLASSDLLHILELALVGEERAVLLARAGGEILWANPSGEKLRPLWRAALAQGALTPTLAGVERSGVPQLLEAGRLVGRVSRLLPAGEDAGGGVLLFRAAQASALAEIHRLLVHDLRSPVQALIAEADLLSQASAAELPDRLAEFHAVSEQVHTAINGLLMLEASGDVGAETGFEPGGVLQGLDGPLRGLAKAHGRRLQIHLPERPVAVRGPVVVVRSLFQNLIDNAIKHGHGDVRVELRQRLRSEGAWEICLDLRQMGDGLPLELFDWLRSGQAPATGGATAGSGLQLVRAAMRHLSGRWEREILPGELFQAVLRACFVLPEAAPGLDGSPAARPAVHAAGDMAKVLAGTAILVVEDSPVSRDWAVHVLREAGAQVSWAPDGHAALILAQSAQSPPDIVLLDLTLPGMDGITVARRLRAGRRGAALRIVGLTGHADPETRKACLTAGMDMVLTKPITASALRREIGRYRASSRQEGSGMMPSDRNKAGGSQLFDAEIRAELRDDLGAEGARQFMLRALDEAEATLRALREAGFGTTTRPQIHSAVGATGITGLSRVEAALREVQDTGHAGGSISAALQDLDQAIRQSRQGLSDRAP